MQSPKKLIPSQLECRCDITMDESALAQLGDVILLLGEEPGEGPTEPEEMFAANVYMWNADVIKSQVTFCEEISEQSRVIFLLGKETGKGAHRAKAEPEELPPTSMPLYFCWENNQARGP